MKKSLLALAVLGAFATAAQAQTNVTIGGVVSVSLQNYKLSSPNAARGAGAGNLQNELLVADNYNTRFWLTGTEDLGGGLSALFYIENRLNADSGAGAYPASNGLGNGDTFIGLKGGWGQVTAGKHTMMAAQGLVTEVLTGSNTIAAMPSGAFGTYSILNQGGARLTTGATLTTYLDAGTRRNNSIMYRLPNLSGFTGSLGIVASGGGGSSVNEGQAGTVPTRDYSDGREWFLQGGYANGPLFLNAAYWDVKGEGRGFTNPAAGTYDIQQLRLSGSYKFGGFKLGLQYDRAETQLVVNGTDTGGEVKRNAWSVPVSYGFGNNTVFASYTQAGDRTGVANSGAKMYTLGYDYALSKRTNVGVFYSRLDNEVNGGYTPFLSGSAASPTSFTGSSTLAGETATTIALGLKHTF